MIRDVVIEYELSSMARKELNRISWNYKDPKYFIT